MTERVVMNSLQWVSVRGSSCQKVHYFNLPFCDRVKNISEIGGEVAEIQTGLQIQIDKDNSVSDLCFISIVGCFCLFVCLFVCFGLTTHSLKFL